MKPFLSIIIPTLNEEKFIPGLLKDLTRQKEKNFEVIIIDGNSIDRTKEVVLSYSSKLLLKYFKVNIRNVSFQRNYGSKKARGDYFVFLDADSGINKNFTKVLEREIKRKKGLLFIPYIVPDEKNQETKLIFDFANFLVEVSQNTRKAFSTGGCMFIEKNFFKNIDGFDEKLFISEDHHLIQKASKWGVKAKLLNRAKVKFSLRRMKKEGGLRVLYKDLIAIAHFLLKGKIDKKIFNYEMGGQLYQKEKKENPRKIIKKYLTRVERFFNELF